MAENPPGLAAALQALAQAIQNIPQVQQAVPHQPLLDPYTDHAPFDLSSHAGSQAFATACTTLVTFITMQPHHRTLHRTQQNTTSLSVDTIDILFRGTHWKQSTLACMH